MEPYEVWVTEDTARSNAEAMVDAIREEIRQKTYDGHTFSNKDLAKAAYGRHQANISMPQEWFFGSVGIVDIFDGDKQSFFLSQATNANAFAVLNVVSWTNWIGDLYVKLKHEIEEGRFPKTFEYGPPNQVREYPVGPYVEYQFRGGHVADCRYVFGEIATVAEVFEEADADTVPSFGLGQIIRSIDVTQNEQIRGPMHGVFILIGGPGVGKTTVALHRIPYLINEQFGCDDDGVPRQAPGDDIFFQQTNALVIVWKEHLIEYLRKCIIDLMLFEFPKENVCHVDSWIDNLIRDYIPIGPEANQFCLTPTESDEISTIKLDLNESHVGSFLDSAHAKHKALLNGLNELYAEIRKGLNEIDLELACGPPVAEFTFMAESVQQYCNSLLSGLPAADLSDQQKKRTDEFTRRIRTVRTRELKRVSGYCDVLYDFYCSDDTVAVISETFGHERAAAFSKHINAQFEERRISRADTYLLLWIIHLQTSESTVSGDRHQPLGKYSHIVIDEAQYYHPSVLRLLVELAQLPDGVVTIVGDLEQRITVKGGLISWEDIGLEIPSENINRLAINYRSSKRVFEFLKTYRDVAGISEVMEAPRRWPSGKGVVPRILTVETRSEEFYAVAEAIHEMRGWKKRGLQTVAVVVPDENKRAATAELIEPLKSYGIPCRWAGGMDVKESVDQVIVTDRHSIVGLEFDVVFLTGADQFLRGDSTEDICAVWVALSRAKRYVHVSRVVGDRVFDDPRFDVFRQ